MGGGVRNLLFGQSRVAPVIESQAGPGICQIAPGGQQRSRAGQRQTCLPCPNHQAECEIPAS